MKASFAQAPAGIDAAKRMLRAAACSPFLGERLIESERGLMAARRAAGYAIADRRSRPAGYLERAMQSLEDDALRRIDQALLARQDCRAEATRSSTGALAKCDAALESVRRARAALATVDTWFVDTAAGESR